MSETIKATVVSTSNVSGKGTKTYIRYIASDEFSELLEEVSEEITAKTDEQLKRIPEVEGFESRLKTAETNIKNHTEEIESIKEDAELAIKVDSDGYFYVMVD